MKKFDYFLELSPEKARELGHALVEHLLEYQARLAALPVVKVESTAALRGAIWEELPTRGIDPLAVLERMLHDQSAHDGRGHRQNGGSAGQTCPKRIGLWVSFRVARSRAVGAIPYLSGSTSHLHKIAKLFPDSSLKYNS